MFNHLSQPCFLINLGCSQFSTQDYNRLAGFLFSTITPATLPSTYLALGKKKKKVKARLLLLHYVHFTFPNFADISCLLLSFWVLFAFVGLCLFTVKFR